MLQNLSALSDFVQPAPLLADAMTSVWSFFAVGGPFMVAIIACSLVALAVIVFKIRTLTKSRIVPDRLAGEVERMEEFLGAGSLGQLEEEVRGGRTSLARLCAIALREKSSRSP